MSSKASAPPLEATSICIDMIWLPAQRRLLLIWVRARKRRAVGANTLSLHPFLSCSGDERARELRALASGAGAHGDGGGGARDKRRLQQQEEGVSRAGRSPSASTVFYQGPSPRPSIIDWRGEPIFECDACGASSAVQQHGAAVALLQ